MSPSTVLITGGYGCIGAETTKWFLDNTDASVVICSRSVSDARTQRVFHGHATDRITALPVDISQPDQIAEVFDRRAVSHVVHLAALQTPDCNANRDLGLQVNLAGTQHLLEVMKEFRQQIQRFVFASSIAVYGPRSQYPPGVVPSSATAAPAGPYGVWKLAGEHLSRLFHQETSVPTICLRPAVLYGPGRDIGLTSSPTTAMKYVIHGLPYEIPFRTRQDYQFAPDVGAATAISAWEPFDDFGVFTMPSHTMTSKEIVEVIQRVASQMQKVPTPNLSVGNEDVPFICDLDCVDFLERFPMSPHTSIEEGVRRTLEEFARQFNRGALELR